MTEHVPGARSVTMVPLTVQTDTVVEANVTARPELAVAVRATWPAFRVADTKGAKVIV